MRTISFRAKSKKTGEWVFGYYAFRHIPSPNKIFTPHYCIFIASPKYGTEGGYWEEIDPSTLGQYTGEQDINGKNIYEGDVLRIYEKEGDFDGGYRYRALKGYHKVFWSEDALAFRIKDDEGFCQDFELNYEKYEVVGDIYDERFEDWEMSEI